MKSIGKRGLSKKTQNKINQPSRYENKRILIIVPAFNEEKNIKKTITKLLKSEINFDIALVNDGSMDSTLEEARKFKQINILDLAVNLGIGGAVQTGFKYASRNDYDIAIQYDVDGQHEAGEIPKLLSPIYKNEADVVIGSRFLKVNKGFKSTFFRRIGILVFKYLNMLLIRQIIRDNTSGFRAYNKKALNFLAKYYPIDYPEPESVILLGKHNFKIKEVPVVMKDRKIGKSSIRGWQSIFYMVKVVLSILMTFIRKKKKM